MYNNDFLNLNDVMHFRKSQSYPKILSLYLFFFFKWLVKFILWLNSQLPIFSSIGSCYLFLAPHWSQSPLRVYGD
jgi:hypothetical protein